MSICSTIKENAWVAAGSLIGLTLGGVSTFIHTGSIFGKRHGYYIGEQNLLGGFTGLIRINNFREGQLQQAIHGASLQLINPVLPCIYLVPLFACAVWNILNPQEADSRGWRHLSKDIILPAMCSMLVSHWGFAVREYVFDHSNRNIFSVLSVSGHVIHQMAQNVYVMEGLQGLRETGTPFQKKIFTIFHAIVAITDGIWMFNTAANHHSVADVIAGLACTGLAYTGVEGVKLLFKQAEQYFLQAPLS